MTDKAPSQRRWRDLIWAAAATMLGVSPSPRSPTTQNRHHWGVLTWTVIGAASVYAWVYAGQQSYWRLVLVTGVSVSSFMVGCLAGFLFTSYGEESATVGKIRDWLIGGITGLTIAKAGQVKALLLTFAAGPGPREFAIVAGAAIAYAILGFFFMFFQRELILNVLLAQSRAERLKLEGSGEAGKVLQRVLAALPPSLLSGVDNVDDSARFRKQEAEKLRVILYSSDVQNFLDDCEDALKAGRGLDWDVVSKAANLHYYRTYFEKDDRQFAQANLANSWITRALNLNPLHVDFTVKYADTLGMMDRYDEAVAVLERLEGTPDAPAYVEQWLGYFLLFVDRLDESIRRLTTDAFRTNSTQYLTSPVPTHKSIARNCGMVARLRISIPTTAGWHSPTSKRHSTQNLSTRRQFGQSGPSPAIVSIASSTTEIFERWFTCPKNRRRILDGRVSQ
jgi:hypothetical protein